MEQQGLSLDSVRQNYTKLMYGAAAALGVVLVLVFIISNIGNLSAPNLQSVSPNDGSTGVTPFAQVAIKFDRNISFDNQKNLKIEPSVSGKTLVSGQELTFTPDVYFALDTKYTVTLATPVGNWGAKGNTVSFSFTTKKQSDLTQDEQDKLQGLSSVGLGLEAKNAAQNDPLIKQAYAVENFSRTLPYETDGYSISYISNTGVYVIYIKQSPYKDNQKKALDYIKSFGVDTNAITIQYTSAVGVH